MKKLLLLFLVTFPVIASNNMEESIDVAKYFCGDDIECINILSVELSTSFHEGFLQSKKDAEYKISALKNKANSLSSLCEKAPNSEICETYRGALMDKYIAGINQ
ncbi:valyl tRNA synthetase modifier [Proteus phage SJ_PmiM]|uniref:Valyl tRNA synthetase modifier n=2 Tax=Bragavirus TaxID=2948639 RepID=A0A0G2SS58_9CAUD|nr:valyl tRNA synthetase modifier [Proteus phage vB_PmiM_Pm5461]YP_010091968.1 valyl tRNA synthetase modifier [Proteus phage PM2]AKA61958.1 valyl tRNA synthetase modifier [Proteus phage vB_PmiM_Pm5461]ASZ76360.1 hypothetical protein [Proteus phage PM2]QQV89631.1 valyl tRNA synthetase modifier [Proteus phage SJ_PmiM]